MDVVPVCLHLSSCHLVCPVFGTGTVFTQSSVLFGLKAGFYKFTNVHDGADVNRTPVDRLFGSDGPSVQTGSGRPSVWAGLRPLFVCVCVKVVSFTHVTELPLVCR